MATKNEKAKGQAPAAEKTEVREDFFTRNSKLIYGILIAIVIAVVIGFFWYRHAEGQKTEAAEKYAAAIQHLENAMPQLNGSQQLPAQFWSVSDVDSLEFHYALDGTEDEMGLLAILDEYGRYCPKTIKFDIATCYLHLGDFENAITYADEFETEDPILESRALFVKGNAQMELGQFEAAKASFLASADKADIDLAAASLFNAGLAAEQLGDLESALNLYTKIRDRYSNSVDQRYPTSGTSEAEYWNIETQISRVETLLAK